jgi:hypothetical protein
MDDYSFSCIEKYVFHSLFVYPGIMGYDAFLPIYSAYLNVNIMFQKYYQALADKGNISSILQ